MNAIPINTALKRMIMVRLMSKDPRCPYAKDRAQTDDVLNAIYGAMAEDMMDFMYHHFIEENPWRPVRARNYDALDRACVLDGI